MSVKSVDWANSRLPVNCYGDSAQTVKVKDGWGTAGGYDVLVQPPDYGTAGSRHIALIGENCIGADSGPSGLLAFADGPGSPQFLGYLIDQSEGYKIKDIVFSEGVVTITATAVQDGSAADPDLLVTSVWTFGHNGKPRETFRAVGTDPDWAARNAVRQNAVRNSACAKIRDIDAEIRTNQQAKAALSGGSVEGTPTWSESAFMSNLSHISSINFALIRLRQARASMVKACNGA